MKWGRVELLGRPRSCRRWSPEAAETVAEAAAGRADVGCSAAGRQASAADRSDG